MMEPWPKTMNPQPANSCMRRRRFFESLVRGVAFSVLALLAVPAIIGEKSLVAQTNAPQPANPAQQQKTIAKAAKPRRRAAAHVPVMPIERRPAPEVAATPAAAQTAPPPTSPAAGAPDPPAPAPPAPIWPANQPPNQAKVSWDGRGLEIDAFNSSLDQILQQVAADTGAKLEGLSQNQRSGDQRSGDQRVGDQSIHDQRIFGTYGPGPARDVLTKLLDGFGYNVLIVGGRNADAPLEVVFLASSPAGSQAAVNNQNRSNPEDDDADPLPEAQRAPPMETPFGNGDSGKPENPQQIMQDILNRQHKIDQQQQEQQNNPQQ